MELIIWEKKYEVGIEAIDNQHKRLVGLLNELFESMRMGESKTITLEVLHELVKYAQTHFKLEEEYFEKAHYEAAEGHIKEHEYFTKNIEDFIRNFEAGHLKVTYKLLTFLREWLYSHILNSDQKYVESFRKAGLA